MKADECALGPPPCLHPPASSLPHVKQTLGEIPTPHQIPHSYRAGLALGNLLVPPSCLYPPSMEPPLLLKTQKNKKKIGVGWSVESAGWGNILEDVWSTVGAARTIFWLKQKATSKTRARSCLSRASRSILHSPFDASSSASFSAIRTPNC